MILKSLKIKNFRKLKSCTLELHEKQTILVGANNSGKTSAITAIKKFLKEEKLSALDFTITNWKEIIELGENWITADSPTVDDIKTFQKLSPTMDVFIEVKENELHYVSHLIPTLDWEVGTLAVRLSYEPKDIDKLFKDFKKMFLSSENLKHFAKDVKNEELSLFPKNLKAFLEKYSNDYFKIIPYLIDPEILTNKTLDEFDDLYYQCQVQQSPFKNILKIDLIDANRGFSDESGASYGIGGLTEQARSLFSKYLDPEKEPNKEDIEALSAIENAKLSFDSKLNSSFKDITKELNNIGYPGFTDPQIRLSSQVNLSDTLNHESSVRLNIYNDLNDNEDYFLPEKYNGLGYQNLISMVLKLIRFRYDWMKEKKSTLTTDIENVIPPLQLVLIEEPEAHLHSQVQQVFINKAYSILRDHKDLKNSEKFKTQMVVSTHSSHIAHEIPFASLRYFKKNNYDLKTKLPCCEIVNLSDVFGGNKDTERFVTRYIKLTHCDLFFADAVILVEGAAEKILLPNFIKKSCPELNHKYITLLEIGGSHAHKLKPLIEKLGLITLIITDLDSKDTNGKVLPQRNLELTTDNDTLKTWLPQKNGIDELISLNISEKKSDNNQIMVCYQMPLKIIFDGIKEEEEEVIPYTFEDSLIFTNLEFFRNLTANCGLSRKLINAISGTNLNSAHQEIFNEFKYMKKAEIALNLLYLDNIEDNLTAPAYILDGLKFLSTELNKSTLYENTEPAKKELENANS